MDDTPRGTDPTPTPPKKRKTGRPKLPPGHSRLFFTVLDEVAQEIEKRARASDLPVDAWLRARVVGALERDKPARSDAGVMAFHDGVDTVAQSFRVLPRTER